MDVIFFSVVEMFVAIVGWFESLLDSTGLGLIYLSAVIICICYKFLFAPVFGFCKSDLAKKSYNAFKRRKEK